MVQTILCSSCFTDQGLKLDAFKIGVEENSLCPNCQAENGNKLDMELLRALAHRFFVRGTIHRFEYGGAPVFVSNEQHYRQTDIVVSEWLKNDLKMIEEAIKVVFFRYGPRLGMVGEVEPLKSLQRPSERHGIIQRILTEYPQRTFH